jgi:hypothetical protein
LFYCVAVGLYLVFRKVGTLGYEKAKVRRFISYHSSVHSSGGLYKFPRREHFYHPSQFWSFALLSDIVSSA